jgi:L-threonylcarbamoyladenylate synthase
VAVRVPAHPAAQQLLRAVAIPIAAPSANRSTFVSPTEARHVMASLQTGVDLVVDAGPTGYGIESTIVDVTREPFMLLRYGAIPLSSLLARVEVVDAASGVTAEGEDARSPGRDARHYAPRASLALVPTDEVAALRERLTRSGLRVGAVLRHASLGDRENVLVEVLPEDAAAFAARLFASLHRLDEAGCDRIVVESVPQTPEWAAVADRLRRAAQRVGPVPGTG